MVIYLSPTAVQAFEEKVMFGTNTLQLQDHVRIIEVDMDQELRFDRNFKHDAHPTLLKVSALRTVASFLDNRGIQLLNKVQVSPYIEYEH